MSEQSKYGNTKITTENYRGNVINLFKDVDDSYVTPITDDRDILAPNQYGIGALNSIDIGGLQSRNIAVYPYMLKVGNFLYLNRSGQQISKIDLQTLDTVLTYNFAGAVNSSATRMSYNPNLDRLYFSVGFNGDRGYIDLALINIVGLTNSIYGIQTHDLQYNPINNKVYGVSVDSGDDRIVIFNDDLSDNGVISIPLSSGDFCTHVTINTTNGDIYTCSVNGRILAYDINGNNVLNTIIPGATPDPFFGYPAPPSGYNPSNNKIYIAINSVGVVVIDGTTRTIDTTIDTSPYYFKYSSVQYTDGVILVSANYTLAVDSNSNIIYTIDDSNNVSFTWPEGNIIYDAIRHNGEYFYHVDQTTLWGTIPSNISFKKDRIFSQATDDRYHLLPDKSGTIAHINDIPQNFYDLADVQYYGGQPLKLLRVNLTEDQIEYIENGSITKRVLPYFDNNEGVGLDLGLPALTTQYRQLIALSVSIYSDGGLTNPNNVTTFDIKMGAITIAQIPVSWVLAASTGDAKLLVLDLSNSNLNPKDAITLKTNNNVPFATASFFQLFLEFTYGVKLCSDY